VTPATRLGKVAHLVTAESPLGTVPRQGRRVHLSPLASEPGTPDPTPAPGVAPTTLRVPQKAAAVTVPAKIGGRHGAWVLNSELASLNAPALPSPV